VLQVRSVEFSGENESKVMKRRDASVRAQGTGPIPAVALPSAEFWIGLRRNNLLRGARP